MADPKEPSDFFKNLAAYRQHLVDAEQQMQAEYDKAVLVLSGGAIGLSMTFLKDIVGANPTTHIGFLLCAWIFWSLSIVSNFISFYASSKALRQAIKQVDVQEIYLTLANSGWAKATAWLNVLAGVFFIVGMAMIIVFVGSNLK
jgi:uncharacterized membrane protein